MTGKGQNRQSYFIINLIATITYMAINCGITFFFTPYLVQAVGSEANGFVNLANNTINYATIITVAISSVAGRFITIKIHQEQMEEANKYFNSVLGANIIMAVLFAFIMAPVIFFLESIFQIPEHLLHDVKLLFLFITINFIITLVSNVFSVATFVENKLYLTNIGNCTASLLRVVLLVVMFACLPANVVYVGVVAVLCSLFIGIYNFGVTKKLLTGIHISVRKFSVEKIKELFSAGIWSSITKLSQVLADGLDTAISNIFVGSYEMGQLTLAYIIPSFFAGLISNISSLFNPQQTYYYAKGDIQGVVHEIRTNMKLTGFFSSIIFAGIITYGHDFFSLWAKGQNIDLIYSLAILSIVSVLVSGVASPLNSVFLLTNHLKVNSIVWVVVSFFDTVLVLLLLKTTSMGIYAVAGVSKIVGIIVNLTYLPIYASKCLGISPKEFYPLIFRYIVVSFGMLFLFNKISYLLPGVSNYFILLVDCLIVGVIGIVVNFIFLLGKKERKEYYPCKIKKSIEY